MESRLAHTFCLVTVSCFALAFLGKSGELPHSNKEIRQAFRSIKIPDEPRPCPVTVTPVEEKRTQLIKEVKQKVQDYLKDKPEEWKIKPSKVRDRLNVPIHIGNKVLKSCYEPALQWLEELSTGNVGQHPGRFTRMGVKIPPGDYVGTAKIALVAAGVSEDTIIKIGKLQRDAPAQKMGLKARDDARRQYNDIALLIYEKLQKLIAKKEPAPALGKLLAVLKEPKNLSMGASGLLQLSINNFEFQRNVDASTRDLYNGLVASLSPNWDVPKKAPLRSDISGSSERGQRWKLWKNVLKEGLNPVLHERLPTQTIKAYRKMAAVHDMLEANARTKRKAAMRKEQTEQEEVARKEQTEQEESMRKRQQEFAEKVQRIQEKASPIDHIDSVRMAAAVYPLAFTSWAEIWKLADLNQSKGKYLHLTASALQPLGGGKCLLACPGAGRERTELLANTVHPRQEDFAFQKDALYEIVALSKGVTTYETRAGEAQAISVELIYVERL